LGALKKKKKKKTTKVDDFEAKLAEAGAGDEDGADGEAGEDATGGDADAGEEGDMDEGTGIWQHDSEKPINYNLLLNRFFKLLNAHNPDLMSSGGKSSIRIPPPQCLREGHKKTIFANISEISKRMKRSEEHVTSYLFTELGTNGSTDGSRRLVIKGKFLQKQIENVLRRYIGMFAAIIHVTAITDSY
jgi:translation initiation factor 2 subunit 2